MMKYKGYTAVVEFDDDAKVFHGEVADTMDVITFQSANAKELEKEFHKSVDEYQKFCLEMKRIPEKPFSGKLLLRLSPSLHRKLYIDAIDKGESLNHHITEMLRQA